MINQKIPFGEIKEFYGTSLSSIDIGENKVIKRYSGKIYRGFEKLRNEKIWLEKLPTSLKTQFSLCVPEILKYIETENLVELHLSLIPRTSLTKGILKGNIDNGQALSFMDHAIALLTENIYPIRNTISSGDAIFQQYHSSRLFFANYYLQKLPFIHDIFSAKRIIINDMECPPIFEVLNHIQSRSSIYFTGSRLVAFHGNLHLDNILASSSETPSKDEVTLIDPRGELVGPSHYDFSKLLLTLEGYYDEISYNGFRIDSFTKTDGVKIDFDINTENSELYEGCLRALMSKLKYFSELENTSEEQFYLSVMVSEWVHVFSFLFYHYNKEPEREDKIIAFIAILALLGNRLLGFKKRKNIPKHLERLRLRP